MTHIPVMLNEIVLTALAPRAGRGLSGRDLRRRRLCGRYLGRRPLHALGDRPRSGRHRPRAPPWRSAISRTAAPAARQLRRVWSNCSPTEGVTSLDGRGAGYRRVLLPDRRPGARLQRSATTAPLDMRMDRAGPTAADLVAMPARSRVGRHTLPVWRGAAVPPDRQAPSWQARVGGRRSPPRRNSPAIIRRVVPKDGSGIDPATRSVPGVAHPV